MLIFIYNSDLRVYWWCRFKVQVIEWRQFSSNFKECSKQNMSS